MKKIEFLLICVLIIFFANHVQASMISPSSIINNTLGVYRSDFPVENLINHSGLKTDFVNGITELSTYAAGDTRAWYPGVSTNGGFVSLNNGVTSGTIDFDLGSIFTISSFLLWNDHDGQGINNFALLIDDNSDFSSPLSLGSFSAIDNDPIYMQQFNFEEATGQYVRLQIFNTNNLGGLGAPALLVNFGEVAFDTSNNNSVPEPATTLLFGLGLLGLAGVNRRKKYLN